ncbi:MAG: oligosaccharide flippase family protein [Kiritimatiellae bacterium]|nr:oligosaccharide flippase family protein [Kiritimatiellia bacterium]
MNKTVVQVIKNTVSGWGMVSAQAAIALVMVPFLIGKLGVEGYGVIAIITAIVGFSMIADLGLRAALNRELSEKVACHDVEGFRSLTATALVLYVVIALLIGAVGGWLAPWFCTVFNVGPDYRALTILLIRTYAPFTLLASFVAPVLTAGICSFMRYDVQNNVSTLSQFAVSLLLLATLTFVEANPLVVWCGVTAIGWVLRIGLLWVFYRRICYGGLISLRRVEVRSLRPLMSLGGSMYVLQLTQMLAQQMDPLIVSRFIGPAGVALYQAGSRLPQMIRPMVTGLTEQLTPLTTKYHVVDNRSREQQVLILGTRYTLYLGALLSVGMLLLAKPFCHLWLFDKLGADVHSVAMVLQLWAVVILFNCAGGPQWPIVLGKKKMRFSVVLSVTTAIFNVMLSIYLVGYTNWGVAGVLIGTVITEIVRRPIAAWYVANLVGVGVFEYARKAYVVPFLFAGVFLLLGRWVVPPEEGVTWGRLLACGLGIGFIGGCLWIVFEWRMARSVFRHWKSDRARR